MRAGRSRWRGRSWRAAGSSHEAPEEDLFVKGPRVSLLALICSKISRHAGRVTNCLRGMDKDCWRLGYKYGMHDDWEYTRALGHCLLFSDVALGSLHIEAHTLMFEYGAAHTIQWKHDET